MRKIYFRCALKLFIIFILPFAACAQPFWNEIKEFKSQDSIAFPPKRAILFVGSSSFRLWKDVHHYFPGHTIINRGFGGSSISDVLHYANDIIFPYQPKQIVLYCGENDLAQKDVTASVVFERFKDWFKCVRNHDPSVNIVYVSIKPSPSRAHLMPAFEECNRLIRNFLKKKRNTIFVDVYSKMLTKSGRPRAELFLEDQLHMNSEGHALWKEALEPFLMK